MKLIAKQSVMVGGTLIKPGQELPQSDLHRVAAWLKSGAAERVGDAPVKGPEKEPVTGKPATKKTDKQG